MIIALELLKKIDYLVNKKSKKNRCVFNLIIKLKTHLYIKFDFVV